MKLKIAYKPHKYQRAFHNSKARIRACITGIGGGKTICGINELIKFAIQNPRSHCVLLGPTYPILKVALRELEKYLPRGIIEKVKYSDREYRLKNGSIIEWKSCEDADGLRGIGPDLIYIDESALLSEKAWDIAYSRATRHKKAFIILTTTPKGQSWLYNKVVRKWEAGNKDYEVFSWKTIDNPYADPEVVAEAKATAKRAKQNQWFKQEYEGVFIKEGGIFYYNFNETRIIEDRYEPKNDEVILGIDIGLAAATVGIWIAYREGNYTAFKEYYREGDIISVHAAILADESKKYNLSMAFIDPSVTKRSEITGTSLLDEFKYGLMPMAANNDWLIADKRINDLFGRGRLFVTRDCPHLIDNLQECNRDPRTGKPLVKRKFHASDAFRYGIVSSLIMPHRGVVTPKIDEHAWVQEAKDNVRRERRLEREGIGLYD